MDGRRQTEQYCGTCSAEKSKKCWFEFLNIVFEARGTKANPTPSKTMAEAAAAAAHAGVEAVDEGGGAVATSSSAPSPTQQQPATIIVTVFVASTSAIKLQAVKQGFDAAIAAGVCDSALDHDHPYRNCRFVVKGVSVPSGVPEQPIAGQTLLGATNRFNAVLEKVVAPGAAGMGVVSTGSGDSLQGNARGDFVVAIENGVDQEPHQYNTCLLYTSPSPRDRG